MSPAPDPSRPDPSRPDPRRTDRAGADRWTEDRAVGAGEGTLSLSAAPRVDFGRLRASRRQAVLDAMAEADLDVLVLGREDNARYVSGARRLWTSGTRPFGPSCVVVAGDAAVHLLSTWADGVPAEIPFDACYGLTWNGARAAAALGAIPGLADARRIGVDGMSHGGARLLGHVAPRAAVVDASSLLQRVRAVKDPDELACMATAVAVAESAVVAAASSLEPGTCGRVVAGGFAERLGNLGLSVTDGPAVVAPAAAVPLPRRASSEPLPDGELVAICGAVLYEGYRGDAGFTWRCTSGGPGEPPDRLLARWRRLRDALVEVARPGRPASDLLAAWEQAGEPLPPGVVAHGAGLGLEPPVVSPRLAGAGSLSLLDGAVLTLRPHVVDADHGGLFGVTVVRVSTSGAGVLSRLDPGDR